MKLTEFKDLLEIYGSDLSRWPQSDLAQAFLSSSKEAMRLWKAEKYFEEDLELLREIPVSDKLSNRIIARSKKIVQRDLNVHVDYFEDIWNHFLALVRNKIVLLSFLFFLGAGLYIGNNIPSQNDSTNISIENYENEIGELEELVFDGGLLTYESDLNEY